jgi:hypothetical protein
MLAGCQWLIPVILATQEAEIRRISVQSQSEQKVCKTLSWKKPFFLSLSLFHTHTHTHTHTLKRDVGMAQSGPEFRPQYHKKKVPKVVNCFTLKKKN